MKVVISKLVSLINNVREISLIRRFWRDFARNAGYNVRFGSEMPSAASFLPTQTIRGSSATKRPMPTK